MNLPTQYPYNLKWRLMLFVIGSGVLWLALMGLECSCWPHGFTLWFGFTPIIFGLLATVRRFTYDVYLVLDQDGITLPTGLGRVRRKRILYVQIERAWETHLPLTMVLSLATKEGKFEIVSTMLPDRDSYLDVGRFLCTRVGRRIPD